MLQTLCFVLLFLYVWETHIYLSKCPPKYKIELLKNFPRVQDYTIIPIKLNFLFECECNKSFIYHDIGDLNVEMLLSKSYAWCKSMPSKGKTQISFLSFKCNKKLWYQEYLR